MTWPTEPLGVLFHHPCQRGDARRQAETVEAFPNCLPSRFHHRGRDRFRYRDSLLHGVAFLHGFDTQSLQAQGEQRRSFYFNTGRDIPELGEEDNKALSKLTGLSEPQIERCKKLIDLPERFQKLSLDPDPKTRIPSNFWIESAPVLDFAVKEIPNLRQLGRNRSTEKLIDKYRAKKIKSVIHFRRIMDAYGMSEGDPEMRQRVLDRVEQYFLRPDLETRAAFDDFVADMRRTQTALTECDEFVSRITRLKLEYIADDAYRNELRQAFRKVYRLCLALEEQLRGSDDPDLADE